MFEDLDKQIFNCDMCKDLVEHFPNSKTISIGKNNDIVIVGEAPANNGWRKSGVAWYDVNQKLLTSGVVMQKLLDIINVKLEETYFFEAIKCYPKDRKYLKECGKNCKKYTLEQLKIINSKYIFLLGDASTKAILDIKYKKFSDVAGKEYKIDGLNSIIIPIYHPSPISPVGYSKNIPIFEQLNINVNC